MFYLALEMMMFIAILLSSAFYLFTRSLFYNRFKLSLWGEGSIALSPVTDYMEATQFNLQMFNTTVVPFIVSLLIYFLLPVLIPHEDVYHSY